MRNLTVDFSYKIAGKQIHRHQIAGHTKPRVDDFTAGYKDALHWCHTLGYELVGVHTVTLLPNIKGVVKVVTRAY